MYCSNCGNKVDEKAVVCVKCGVLINNKNGSLQCDNKPNKGKGIASMILGIIAVYFSLSTFSNLPNISSFLEPFYRGDMSLFSLSLRFVLLQSIFAIIAISLAISEAKNNKNGFNISGFCLSIVSFLISSIEVVYIITY